MNHGDSGHRIAPPRWRLALLFALVVAFACQRGRRELSVATATSLRNVMPELIAAYEASGRAGAMHLTATYAASGDLKRQVEAGAPVDVVVFAGRRPLDDLVAEGRVDAASCRSVASNELVLVGKKSGPAVTFESLETLAPGESVAMGDPRMVPAGEYARDYLRALGKWDEVQMRAVTGSNVAAVLAYVRRGEATAGIVYATELRGVTDVVVLDVAHGPLAPRPRVVAGAVRGGSKDAAGFLEFIASAAGQRILASFGFGPP
jgi:molybdate transport system substrate-binding protein